MAMFERDSEEFENGTTVTSQIRITNDEDDLIPADTIIDSGDDIDSVLLKVQQADDDPVILEETGMELIQEDNENNKFFYQKSFQIPEDADFGQYEAIHKVLVGDKTYKRTVLFDVVDVSNKR